MTLTPADTRYLRASALMLALCLALGASAAAFSHYRWQEAEKKHRLTQVRDQEMHQKLAQARQEEAELKEKISRYLTLKQQGIIGAERRLDWVEQFSLIRRERKLPDMQYELSAQHPVDKDLLRSGSNVGGHQFLTSTLKFRTALLHEGDMISLMKDIRTRISAFPIARSCQIERRNADDQASGLNYGLKTECEIELVTIKDPA